MGFADAFAAEDRVNVKFSDFYNLVKGCTITEMMMNGLRHQVQGEEILKVVDGNFQGFDVQDNKEESN